MAGSNEHTLRKVLQELGITRSSGATYGNDNMTADPETGTEDGHISVTIDGNSVQIPVYDA